MSTTLALIYKLNYKNHATPFITPFNASQYSGHTSVYLFHLFIKISIEGNKKHQKFYFRHSKIGRKEI